MEPKNKFLRINGFTLIELIMTIVLIGIVVIPSAIFIAETIRGAFKSEDVIAAVNLARMELERINNLPYTNAEFNIGSIDTTLYSYDLRKTVRLIAQSGGGGGGKGKKPPPSPEEVKEVKIEVYPAGKAGSLPDLIATVITHRSSNVQ